MVNNKIYKIILKAVASGSLLCLLFLTSCNQEKNDPILVQVNDLKLPISQLDYRMAGNEQPTEEDRNNSIEDWVNQAVILLQIDSLPQDIQNEINFKVQDYKASLVRYELENQLIKKELDTTVTEKELKDFYDANKKEFELKDFIVKVFYLKIPSQAPKLQNVNDWYLLRKPTDLENLYKYSDKYALNFYYNQDKWIYFEDLLKEIPLEGIDNEKFILNKTKTNFEDNGVIYYLNILDYKLKNTTSPFDLEKEAIRQRILTNRIKEIRDRMTNRIITNAKKQYEIHYFDR